MTSVLSTIISHLFPELLDEFIQVSRQRHFEAELLTCDGVFESELRGMQSDSRRAAVVRQRLLEQGLAIDFVPAHEMSGFGQVNSDLVCAARLQLTLDQRVVPQPFDGPDMRHRSLTKIWL